MTSIKHEESDDICHSKHQFKYSEDIQSEQSSGKDMLNNNDNKTEFVIKTENSNDIIEEPQFLTVYLHEDGKALDVVDPTQAGSSLQVITVKETFEDPIANEPTCKKEALNHIYTDSTDIYVKEEDLDIKIEEPEEDSSTISLNEFRFTSTGSEEVPDAICLLCDKIVVNSSLIPTKLRSHFETNHPNYKGLQAISLTQGRLETFYKIRKKSKSKPKYEPTELERAERKKMLARERQKRFRDKQSIESKLARREKNREKQRQQRLRETEQQRENRLHRDRMSHNNKRLRQLAEQQKKHISQDCQVQYKVE